MRRYRVPCCLVVILCCTGCPRSEPRVVVYCAQDQEFAAGLFDDFRQRTGLPVVPKYDMEADKSVSLYRELVSAKNRSRCDVFWNNEILSALRLQKQGLLEPYDSPAAQPYPVLLAVMLAAEKAESTREIPTRLSLVVFAEILTLLPFPVVLRDYTLVTLNP